MGQDRFSSFLISICLHLGLLALVLLWPLPEPKLKEPVVLIQVEGFFTQGAPGKTVANAKKQDPAPSQKKEPAPVEKQPEQVQPDITPVAKTPVEPEVVPEVTPVEKVEPPRLEPPKVEPPKPEPQLDPTTVAVPKEEKKAPVKNATAAKPPVNKNATAVKPPANKNATAAVKPPKKQPAQDTKKKKVDFNDVFKDLKKQTAKDDAKGGTRKKTEGTASVASSSIDNELNNLAANLGGSGTDDSGTGPGGSGGDGVGQLGPYEQVIVSSVRPNWGLPPRADRKTLSAVVFMRVDGDGTILSARILRSSGDKMFDSSLLTAIQRTRILDEQPPGQVPVDAEVEFYPN